MQVVRADSQVLQIISRRSRQEPISSLLFALFPMSAGVYFLISPSITTLECNRTPSHKIECVRSAANSFGWKTTEEIPGNLRSAKISTRKGQTSVELLTTQGVTSGTHFSNKDRSIIDNVIKLNNFIDNSRLGNIKIEQDDRQYYLQSTIIISAVGVWTLVFSLCTTVKIICEFNKEMDLVSIDKDYLFHSKKQHISPLSQIKKVALKKAYKDRGGRTFFKVLITLDTDKNYSISTPSSELQSYTKIVEAIEQFLATSDR